MPVGSDRFLILLRRSLLFYLKNWPPYLSIVKVRSILFIIGEFFSEFYFSNGTTLIYLDFFFLYDFFASIIACLYDLPLGFSRFHTDDRCWSHGFPAIVVYKYIPYKKRIHDELRLDIRTWPEKLNIIWLISTGKKVVNRGVRDRIKLSRDSFRVVLFASISKNIVWANQCHGNIVLSYIFYSTVHNLNCSEGI